VSRVGQNCINTVCVEFKQGWPKSYVYIDTMGIYTFRLTGSFYTVIYGVYTRYRLTCEISLLASLPGMFVCA